MNSRPVKLVAFLGKGPYKPCDWVGPNGSYLCSNTRYVPVAILEYLTKGCARHIQEVVIVSTPEAKKSGAVHGQPEPTQWEALCTEMSRILPDVCIRGKDIPAGGTPEELWQTFDTLAKEFEVPEGTDLVLDITHGFRSQPFFAAAVLTFVRLVRGQAPVSIYYGAFDANKSDGRASIWDLTRFVEVLDWALALHLFLKTGRCEGLLSVMESYKDDFPSDGPEGGPAGAYRRLLDAVVFWSSSYEELRIGDLLLRNDKKPSAAERLNMTIENYGDEVAKRLPPLKPVLEEIRKELAAPLICDDDLTSPQGRAALASLANLYLKMGRYIEAVTIVREAVITQYAKVVGDKAWRPGSGFDSNLRGCIEWLCREHLGHNFDSKCGQIRNDLDHAGFNSSPRRAADRAKDYKHDKVHEDVKAAVEWFKSTFVPEWEVPDEFRLLARTTLIGQQSPRLFLNLSNHPISQWDDKQKKAALDMGCTDICELSFPDVPPQADPEEVKKIAEETAKKVPAGVTHAMVMGEQTLTAQLVKLLQRRCIKCFAATTVRDVVQQGDVKITRFHFERFREYPDLN